MSRRYRPPRARAPRVKPPWLWKFGAAICGVWLACGLVTGEWLAFAVSIAVTVVACGVLSPGAPRRPYR